jgi:tetratricopeptide (TPR) repeat protein
LRALLPPHPAIIWGLEQVSGSGELLWQKRVFPNRPEARFQGRVHEQLIHPKAWPSIVSRLLIEHWGYQDPDQLRQKGLYYLRLLNQSIADDPNDYYALFQAARCHFNLRQYAEARHHLHRAVANPQLWQDNPDLGVYAQIMLATTLERLLLGNDSLKLLLELCQRRPDSALAFFAAGKLAYAQGDFSLAAVMLDKSLSLDLGVPLINLNPRQTRFSAHYLLGLALVKLNRLPAAAAQMQKALQIDPAHRGARLDMAETLWRMNNKEAARLNLEMVVRRHPHDIKAGHLVRKWKEHA